MDFLRCRTAAYIDLGNAEHNYNVIKNSLNPGTKIFPVIKADGYGHGAVPLAALYQKLGAEMFCVSCITEAIQLRNNSITLPILILGFTLPEYAPQLLEYDIIQAVHSDEYAHDLAHNIPDGKRMKIHIKLDTGMRRIGFTPDMHPERLFDDAKFEVCGLFTHYAESDNLNSDFTGKQLEKYHKMLSRMEGKNILCHTANSAAALCHPNTHFDGVRPGIILYGEYPSAQVKEQFEKSEKKLMQVMTFTSRITHIFDVKKGESIGYSRTFFAPNDMKIATVCAGYADGVPRLLSNKGKIGIKGRLYNIVGNICMDQFMIDITGADNIKLYDEAVIFGKGGVSCEEVAEICGTISYEIFCSISKRVNRVYIGG